MRLSIVLLAVSLVLGTGQASAGGGYTFKNGRFPEGKVTVLSLTPHQKDFIALYRRCRNNEWTPYIFKLTKTQRAALTKESKVVPSRFAIYETYRGDRDADVEYNIINRFNEGQFEIAHKALDTDKGLKEWEEVMGWDPSPLANVDPRRVKPGTCPK